MEVRLRVQRRQQHRAERPRYLVQEMWSNRLGGCYIPSSRSHALGGGELPGSGRGLGARPSNLHLLLRRRAQEDRSSRRPPRTLNVDFGTLWTVTGTLAGLDVRPRGGRRDRPPAARSGSEGRSRSPITTSISSTSGSALRVAGAASRSPSITLTQFGYQASATASTGAGSSLWVDAQSKYNYTAVLPASSSNESGWPSRRAGPSPLPSAVTPQYYHQFLVPVSYTGGSGTSSPPTLSYSSLGASLSASLGTQPQSLWLDAGAGYSATNPLHGSTHGPLVRAPRERDGVLSQRDTTCILPSVLGLGAGRSCAVRLVQQQHAGHHHHCLGSMPGARARAQG